MKRLLSHLIGAAVVLTAPAWAGENVLLTNGFRLHADRHEIEGNTVRIFSGSGEVEMAASSVAGYEPEEVMAAPPAATAPVAAILIPKPPARTELTRLISPIRPPRSTGFRIRSCAAS